LTWCVAAENDKLSIDRYWWQELFQTLSCWAAKPAELITAAAERYRRLGWLTEERTVDPVQIVIAEFDPLTGEYAWSGQGRWRLQSNRMTKSQLKPKQNPHGRGVLRGEQSLQFVLPRSNRSNAKLLTLLQVTREGERI
jgi:hypothetical protein